ncbi:hypothetical protein [Kozakia baliensis]|uniref:hypothetical protein n=1 Tax=Kozakia baliensis TaxID=153496 RepID=UPI000495CC78|nr:hypothetical protein [Kozakia baliensis]
MPQAVISVMSSGYLQLGHVTPFGIQTSIENFDTFSDTVAFARKNGIRLKYVDGPLTLSSEQVTFLRDMPNAASVNDIASATEWSEARVWNFSLRLESFSFVKIERTKKRRDHLISVTDKTRAFLAGLRVAQ